MKCPKLSGDHNPFDAFSLSKQDCHAAKDSITHDSGRRCFPFFIRASGADFGNDTPNPEIDAGRLGVASISLGGIVGALAGAVEPQFKSVCLILAGGDLGKIIMKSKKLAKHRSSWKGSKLTLDEMREKTRSVDPLTYAATERQKRIDDERIE